MHHLHVFKVTAPQGRHEAERIVYSVLEGWLDALEDDTGVDYFQVCGTYDVRTGIAEVIDIRSALFSYTATRGEAWLMEYGSPEKLAKEFKCTPEQIIHEPEFGVDAFDYTDSGVTSLTKSKVTHLVFVDFHS